MLLKAFLATKIIWCLASKIDRSLYGQCFLVSIDTAQIRTSHFEFFSFNIYQNLKIKILGLLNFNFSFAYLLDIQLAINQEVAVSSP